MKSFVGDLSHTTDEEHSFDFNFWVEEYFFKLSESFEGDLLHSSDEVHSFYFDVWVEEKFFETFEDFFHNLLTTYLLEWWLGNRRQDFP